MADLIKNASLASLKERSAGELMLAGQLDYRSGRQLWQLGRTLIKNSSASQFVLDCSEVTRTSSVGVSLILSLIRDANKVGKTLSIKSLTLDLEEIANFSGLSDILPLATDLKIIENQRDK